MFVKFPIKLSATKIQEETLIPVADRSLECELLTELLPFYMFIKLPS